MKSKVKDGVYTNRLSRVCFLHWVQQREVEVMGVARLQKAAVMQGW